VRDRGNPTSQLPPGKDIATWPTLRLLRDSWRAGQTASSIRRMLAGGPQAFMDNAPLERVALGSTAAIRRFRDVASVPSLIKPAALRGGGLFFGAIIAQGAFGLARRADPARSIDLAASAGFAAAGRLTSLALPAASWHQSK
jgi:hypothetical protein